MLCQALIFPFLDLDFYFCGYGKIVLHRVIGWISGQLECPDINESNGDSKHDLLNKHIGSQTYLKRLIFEPIFVTLLDPVVIWE